MTTLPPSLKSFKLTYAARLAGVLTTLSKGLKIDSCDVKLERETRLELATPTLARSCSTN